MGLTEVLTIVFVVLKFIGKIDWSWWLVCLPEIIALACYVVVLIVQAVNAHKLKREIKDLFKDGV